MRDPYREKLSRTRLTHHPSRLLALLWLLLPFLALFLFLMRFLPHLVPGIRPLLARLYMRGRRATIMRPGRFLGSAPRLRIFTRLGITSRRLSLARANLVISLLIRRGIAFSRLWSRRLFLSSAPTLFPGRVCVAIRFSNWGFRGRVSYMGSLCLAC